MSRMALAAEQGGAFGIRANSVKDITEIKKTVNLPIIGIVKRDYDDSEVFITATIGEVDELMTIAPDMIAIDATDRTRPNSETLEDFVKSIRSKYPDVLLMADISTLDDALEADRLEFACISSTLHGYTENTKDSKLFSNDFQFIKELLDAVTIPVIAEGNVETPEMAKRCLDVGCHAVVVGGAITRPKQITERFITAMK
ncbi:N-acetylmannosamine-6-phosphate 2-epimerase [Photobacterium frigidiphilum]